MVLAVVVASISGNRQFTLAILGIPLSLRIRYPVLADTAVTHMFKAGGALMLRSPVPLETGMASLLVKGTTLI